jgi:tetratricopeptide (TPR) repeat protein
MSEDAIFHYRKFIELTPQDVQVRNNRGVALAIQGKLDQALTERENVLKIDPAKKNFVFSNSRVWYLVPHFACHIKRSYPWTPNTRYRISDTKYPTRFTSAAEYP